MRKICFTIFNDWDIHKFQKIFEENTDKIRYMIVGLETCKKTGMMHFQCYCQMLKTIRGKGFKKMIGDNTTHWEKQKMSNDQARNYCWKGEFEEHGTEFPQPSATFLQFGQFCEQAGQRTDILKIKEEIDDGVGIHEICKNDDVFGTWVRYHSGFEKYKQLVDDEKGKRTIRENIEVIVAYGECATGKTEGIYRKEGIENCYTLENPNGDNKNWNGYSNQKILVIDDFYGWLKLNNILRILDKYPYRCRMLGGYRWACWTKVYITSNKRPEDWYCNIGNGKVLKALYSRICKRVKVTRGNTGALVVTLIQSETKRHSYNEYLDYDDLPDCIKMDTSENSEIDWDSFL